MDDSENSELVQRREPPSAAAAPATLQSVDICTVPLEILEEIFLHLPPHQVVCRCRLVCKEWKEIADSDSLWIERCKREGYHLHDPSKLPKDWRLFYFTRKKRRNLFKIAVTDDKMRSWNILKNDGWKLEDIMEPLPNETVKKIVVSCTQGRGSNSQLINLAKEGYNPAFMDQFQPDIRISDWYAPKGDSGSDYTISVHLMSQSKVIIQTFSPETVYIEHRNDQQWSQVTHVFQNYGPGARYIHFMHGGKNVQLWPGW